MWIESEGTLQSDQRQFGPSIWAPFFVPLKKNVINVLGFYSTRKQTGLSMDYDGSVQTPVNLSALDALERQKGGERNSPKNLNSPKSASNVRQGDKQWSTGAFRDSGAGAGAGAGLGNFWKRWVRVRQDSAIKKLLKIFLQYMFNILLSILLVFHII